MCFLLGLQAMQNSVDIKQITSPNRKNVVTAADGNVCHPELCDCVTNVLKSNLQCANIVLFIEARPECIVK